jgi:hypothetical protein
MEFSPNRQRALDERVFKLLRRIAESDYEQPETIKEVELFGSESSLYYFNDWIACGRRSMDVFGMALLQTPYWLYLDLMLLSTDLFWHREEIKRPVAAGLPSFEGINERAQ